MGKRKSKPQARMGRPEDRDDFLAEACADSGGGWGAAADVLGQALARQPSDDEEEQPQRRVKRRRRVQLALVQDASHHVIVSAAEDQRWRFAEVAVWGWREAASISAAPEQHILEDGQLLFVTDDGETEEDSDPDRQPSSNSSRCIGVRYQSPGGCGQWQGSLSAPGWEEADSLLELLESKHLSCAVSVRPPGDSGDCSLRLGLTDKAAADAAEDPEEHQQRQWHLGLLTLLRWLRPELDPNRELELGQPLLRGGSAAAAELLSSPLCSPRAGAAASPLHSQAQQPGSPAAGAAGGGFDAAELYSAVKPSGSEPELPAGATAGFLLPTLRRYQVGVLDPLVHPFLACPAASLPCEGSQLRSE